MSQTNTEVLDNQDPTQVDISPWKLKLDGNTFEVTGTELFDSGIEAIFHLCDKTQPKQLSAPWAQYVAFSGTTRSPTVLAVTFAEVTDQQIADLALQFQGELAAIILVLKQRDQCQLDRGNLKCRKNLGVASVIKTQIDVVTDENGNKKGVIETPIKRTNYRFEQ